LPPGDKPLPVPAKGWPQVAPVHQGVSGQGECVQVARPSPALAKPALRLTSSLSLSPSCFRRTTLTGWCCSMPPAPEPTEPTDAAPGPPGLHRTPSSGLGSRSSPFLAINVLTLQCPHPVLHSASLAVTEAGGRVCRWNSSRVEPPLLTWLPTPPSWAAHHTACAQQGPEQP
jgi:hypothetical protein